MQGIGTEQSVVVMKQSNDCGAKGLCYPVLNVSQPAMGGTKMYKTKSYDISKDLVWEAYHRVKANKGSAGVDQETLAKFEKT